MLFRDVGGGQVIEHLLQRLRAVAIPRNLFADIQRLIAELRPALDPATA